MSLLELLVPGLLPGAGPWPPPIGVGALLLALGALLLAPGRTALVLRLVLLLALAAGLDLVTPLALASLAALALVQLQRDTWSDGRTLALGALFVVACGGLALLAVHVGSLSAESLARSRPSWISSSPALLQRQLDRTALAGALALVALLAWLRRRQRLLLALFVLSLVGGAALALHDHLAAL